MFIWKAVFTYTQYAHINEHHIWRNQEIFLLYVLHALFCVDKKMVGGCIINKS